jgi:DNA-binding NarL/FixJ family response regulator
MGAVQIAGDGKHRVVVVANDAGIVHAVGRVLRQAAGFSMVGYVAGRAGTAAIVAGARPDVVVVDDLGAPVQAVGCVKEIHEAIPAAKIVLLVPDTELPWLGDAVAAGATAILSKAIDPTSAGTVMREIVRERVFHCLPEARSPAAPAAPLCLREQFGLTPRELELLELVVSGATNGLLARQLFVTEQTVKFHLSNIYRKLGVANRTQATRFAYAHGLVAPMATPGSEPGPVVMRAA